jgi:ABC-type uncharacterized transport system substrate-binding protein
LRKASDETAAKTAQSHGHKVHRLRPFRTRWPVRYPPRDERQYTVSRLALRRPKKNELADALYVCGYDPLVNTSRMRILGLATAARLPTVSGDQAYVRAGGLISYGPNFSDMFRRSADDVDKILRGAKPGQLPVEQPTNFDMIINLKTAKTLDLDVSTMFLARADDVIK